MPSVSQVLAFIAEHTDKNSNLRLDTRVIQPGDVFFALKGFSSDGRKFIRTALANGASCIISEGEEPSSEPKELVVPGLRGKLPEIAAAFYGHPSDPMIGIAVTGTNGKTTTTHWISALLSGYGIPCATIGTIGCFFGNRKIPAASLTTPDILTLESVLAGLREEGCKAFAMEASSIGLEQGRMEGLSIKIAAFTNLTRDHLDYHKTVENYAAAKGILFDWPQLQCAVINIDDPASDRYIAQIKNKGTRLITYSTKKAADLSATEIEHGKDGMSFVLCMGDKKQRIHCSFIGMFNIENFLAAAGCVLAAGVPFEAVCAKAEELTAPKGRMEVALKGANPLVVVDYCHTPDALEKAVTTLQEVQQSRKGKLWVVVGAGGDRDPGKRPMMGAVAAQADFAVITSDNPRSEDPLTIIQQVSQGAPGAVTICDRAKALEYAIKNAQECDVILIAGKGHEDYQEIHGVKHHFSDVEEARKCLGQLRRI